MLEHNYFAAKLVYGSSLLCKILLSLASLHVHHAGAVRWVYGGSVVPDLPARGRRTSVLLPQTEWDHAIQET